ncbi:MAG TPA: filamentous hemagglutinin N-terminal domain-containing protein, partial [Rhodocyclaceae bacterium]
MKNYLQRSAHLRLVVLLAWPSLAVQAQIVADPGAPANQRPTLLKAANGVPLVNIQTPSAAGVSRNAYSQLDVQQQGAILNNARTNAQTQLGGWVQGNPWLAAGTARVILNEVNSSNPSQLRGYVEIAGDRAQVVIANPAGVTCDGCGFINANRITLTTGTPSFSGDSLAGYRVQGGTVAVSGAGMDASQADYTDLIARAVQINAGIWARSLKLTAGANQVDAANVAATPIGGSGPAPAFAIDVAQLGGMYAGQISLVGTEAGVGVRNAGLIGASAGEVAIAVNGQLFNAGSISSSSHSRIDASGDVVNTGTLYAGGNARLTAGGTLDNSGVVAADGDTSVDAAQIASGSNSLLGAGIAGDGSLGASGTLSLTASQGIAAQGRNLAGGNATLTARSIDLSGSLTGAADLTLTASAGDVDAGGATLQGTGTLTVTTPQAFRSGGARVAANGDVGLTVGRLLNAGGLIQSLSGAVRVTSAGAIDNAGGRIESARRATLSGTAIENAGGAILGHAELGVVADSVGNRGGAIQALGDATLRVAGTLDNLGGTLRSAALLDISAASVANAATRADADLGIDGTDIVIRAATIGNASGAIRATTSVTLTSGGSVDNSAGLVSSGDTLAIGDPVPASQTLAVVNTGGTMIAGRMLSIDSANLSGDGELLSTGDIGIRLLGDYTHTGRLQADGSASFRTAGTLVNRAAMQAGNTLSVTAATLDNRSDGVLRASRLELAATDSHTLINRGLIDGSDVVVDAIALQNLGTGRIYGDHLSIGATTLVNAREGGASPVIAARNRLDLGVGTLTNSDGAMIYSAGDMAIGGGLDASGNAIGQAASLTNSSASIEADGNLSLAVDQVLNKRTSFSVAQQGGGAGEAQYAVLEFRPGGPWGLFLAQWITHTDTVITADSGAGVISAGGSMTFNGSVTNDKSDILAGGDIVYDHARYSGIAQQGQTVSSGVGVTDYCISCAYGGFGFFSGYYVLGDPFQVPGLESRAQDGVRVTANYVRSVATPQLLQQWSVSGVPAQVGYIAVNSTDDYGNPIVVYIPPTDATFTAYRSGPSVTANYDLAPARLTANQAIGGTALSISNLNLGGGIGQLASGAQSGTVSRGAAPVTQVNVSGMVVRTGGVSVALPSSSLYTLDRGGRYLVETDPRFANYRSWLGSDYLLGLLDLDPAAIE